MFPQPFDALRRLILGSDSRRRGRRRPSQLSPTPAWVQTLELRAMPSAAPVITGFTAPVLFTEGDSPVVLDSAATVTDSDTTNFKGAVLHVSFDGTRKATDQLSIENEGTGSGQVGVDGHEITFGGTVVAHFAGGKAMPLFVLFNDNATLAAVQAVMQHVTYQNTSNNPSTDTRDFKVRLYDGDGGTSDPVSGTIDVTAVNDAPAIDQFSGSVSYPAGKHAARVGLDAQIKDSDSKSFDGGTLTATLSANGQATDKVSIADSGFVGVSGSNVTFNGKTIGTFTGGTGTTPLVVTFNSDAKRFAVQAVLRHLTFESTSSSPSTAARTLQVVVKDGDGGTSNTASKTINVST